MFTMKKLMGFLMICVLYTIIPITVFPIKEAIEITQYAKVIPIFSPVGLLGQLDSCVPFIVVFMFSDIAAQFLVPLLRSQTSFLLVCSIGNVTLFMF